MPVVGDLAGLGLSGWLIYRATGLGLRKGVIARMVGNVALESVIGVVPVLGDAFDFVFKANERNVRLLERELLARRDELKRADDSKRADEPKRADSTPPPDPAA